MGCIFKISENIYWFKSDDIEYWSIEVAYQPLFIPFSPWTQFIYDILRNPPFFTSDIFTRHVKVRTLFHGLHIRNFTKTVLIWVSRKMKQSIEVAYQLLFSPFPPCYQFIFDILRKAPFLPGTTLHELVVVSFPVSSQGTGWEVSMLF